MQRFRRSRRSRETGDVALPKAKPVSLLPVISPPDLAEGFRRSYHERVRHGSVQRNCTGYSSLFGMVRPREARLFPAPSRADRTFAVEVTGKFGNDCNATNSSCISNIFHEVRSLMRSLGNSSRNFSSA